MARKTPSKTTPRNKGKRGHIGRISVPERPRERGLIQINGGNLFDLISEFMVLEKSSLYLLTQARDRCEILDLGQSFEEYISQGTRQVARLQAAIRELGGNPNYISPSARLQHQRMTSVSQLPVSPKLQNLADMETCWYAALQENVHLAFLRSILPFLESSHAQDVVTPVFDEAARVQEKRLEWLEQSLHRLLLQRAISPVEGTDLSSVA